MSRFCGEMMDGEITLHRKYGCPVCGETRVESLHLAEDGVTVDCASCGCVYDPIEEAKEAANGTSTEARQ